MKIKAWLKTASDQLGTAGISTARLDCLVLLEDVLNTNRTQILANDNRELTEVEETALQRLINKRVQHVPLAYLRYKTEFYGREFYVDERVLEPRPESETMIELLKSLPLNARSKLADIGSGSGALGITAKLELPRIAVTLLEIDSGALQVSQRNARLHKAAVQVVASDLLRGVDEHFDVLLCNLPYVPDDFHINLAASHEPAIAIFGGPDGLMLYRKLFTQLNQRAAKPSYILSESLPPQHAMLATTAQAAGYRQTEESDFIQLFEPS